MVDNHTEHYGKGVVIDHKSHGYRAVIIITDWSARTSILYVTMTTVSYKTREISVIFLSEYLSYTLAVT